LVNPKGCWGTPFNRATVKLNAKNENAKVGKTVRLVGDLSTPASLRGAWITNYLKQAFAAEVISWNGGHFEFVKSPDQQTMERVFRLMHNPPGRFYFVYFSDDSTLAMRVGNEIKYFNLDISSCDASHTEALFIALKYLTPTLLHEDMQKLIDQCKLPVKILSNAHLSRPKRVVIKFHSARLYSGSTLTTAINNLASVLIGLAISKLTVITEATIIEAAASVGYVITGAKPLNNFNEVQFLKHSPVFDTQGQIRAVLNLGVLCRASGVCKEDLPGVGDLVTRAKAFQRGLLQGMYPRAHFTLIDRMKATMGSGEATEAAVASMARKVGDTSTAESYTVADDELYRRYQLTGSEIAELNDVLGTATTGHWLATSGLDKILNLDYGLNCRTTTYAPLLPDPEPVWA
jgi:putative Ca2+/H+ antiporter (TMEM165/GDT1 family)